MPEQEHFINIHSHRQSNFPLGREQVDSLKGVFILNAYMLDINNLFLFNRFVASVTAYKFAISIKHIYR